MRFYSAAQLRKPALMACLAGALALSACQGNNPDTAETGAASEASDSSNPDGKPGIAASGARLVLPVVAGRPAAIYFTVSNNGDTAAQLVSVYVNGAGKTEMHQTEGGKMSAVETVDIAPSASVEFAPGGYHVMAFELADTLQAGATSEMTLTFSDGDKYSMPIAIEKMGAGMSSEMEGGMGGDMEGMHH